MLKDVSSEKEKLDNKVFGLYEKSLDLDLLDEQAKNALGYVNPMNLWLFLTWNSSRLLALPPVIQAPFLSSRVAPMMSFPVLDTGMTSL